MSRQNLLSRGKTYFLTAELFTIAFHNFINRNGRLMNMAAEEDTVDGCTKTLGLMQHGTVVIMTNLNQLASQWLFVTRSNNQPHNIGTRYLESVITYGGCPVDLVKDLRTENGIMADIHAFFRNDPDRHRCVPSPSN